MCINDIVFSTFHAIYTYLERDESSFSKNYDQSTEYIDSFFSGKYACIIMERELNATSENDKETVFLPMSNPYFAHIRAKKTTIPKNNLDYGYHKQYNSKTVKQ